MSHLFKWEKSSEYEIKYAILAAIATATPLMIGYMIAKPTLGVFTTLGCVALVKHEDVSGSLEYLILSLLEMIFGLFGFLFGITMTFGALYTLFLVPFIFFIVGVIGGFNRSFARSSSMFIMFTAIGMNFSTYHISFLMSIYPFIIGSLWMFALTLGYKTLQWQILGRPKLIRKEEPSLKQLWEVWFKEIRSFQGSRYGLRIGLSSFVGMIVIYLFPFPHSAWIILTIGIVVQRNIHLVLQRILQRGLGTIVGVGFLSLTLLFVIKPSVHIMLVVGLALIQSLIMERNYFLYSATITALVVIMIDIGQTITVEIMLERIFATLIGCAIAIIFGYLPWVKNHK